MKEDVKSKIKALEYCVVALKQVKNAKDPQERLSAVELEVEFTKRIERLKESDHTPELELQDASREPAVAGGTR